METHGRQTLAVVRRVQQTVIMTDLVQQFIGHLYSNEAVVHALRVFPSGTTQPADTAANTYGDNA